jgi:hypothetical protein
MNQIIAFPDATEPEWLTWAKQSPPAPDGLDRCQFNSLQILNPYTGELRYALCNRFRHCKRCAELARKAAYARLTTVVWNAFVTLPMPSEHATPTLANIKRQSESLKQFLASCAEAGQSSSTPGFVKSQPAVGSTYTCSGPFPGYRTPNCNCWRLMSLSAAASTLNLCTHLVLQTHRRKSYGT